MKRSVRTSLVVGALLAGAAPRDARAGEPRAQDPPDFFAPSPSPAPILLWQPALPPPRPPPAPAAPLPAPLDSLGSRGQLVIGGGSTVSVSSTDYSLGSTSNLTFTFTPGLDYFVIRNLSLGVAFGVTDSSARNYGVTGNLVQTNETDVLVGPRLGYNFSFGHWASVWPRVTLGLESIHAEQSIVTPAPGSSGPAIAPQTTTLLGADLVVYVPLVLRLSPHLFIGAGPSVTHLFGSPQGGPDFGTQRTYVGAGIEVGGYLGGDPEVPAGSASPSPPLQPRPPPHRFGEARELVLSNEETLGGGYTHYANTGGSISALQLALGIDYFVVPYLSIGVRLQASYTHQAVPDLAGTTITSTLTNFGAGPRVGVNVPLGSLFSIYPRVAIAFGPGAVDASTPAATIESSNLDVAFSASVPLLLHPAEHFFLGLGPYVNHDLWRQVTLSTGSNSVSDATTLGAALIVGGWL